MKMDIEGSETTVLPDMIINGALAHVNTIMIEWHTHRFKDPQRRNTEHYLKATLDSISKYSTTMRKYGGTYDLNIMEMDDELYFDSKFKLPTCYFS